MGRIVQFETDFRLRNISHTYEGHDYCQINRILLKIKRF
jgi:hypothetical protein